MNGKEFTTEYTEFTEAAKSEQCALTYAVVPNHLNWSGTRVIGLSRVVVASVLSVPPW